MFVVAIVNYVFTFRMVNTFRWPRQVLKWFDWALWAHHLIETSGQSAHETKSNDRLLTRRAIINKYKSLRERIARWNFSAERWRRKNWPTHCVTRLLLDVFIARNICDASATDALAHEALWNLLKKIFFEDERHLMKLRRRQLLSTLKVKVSRFRIYSTARVILIVNHKWMNSFKIVYEYCQLESIFVELKNFKIK